MTPQKIATANGLQRRLTTREVVQFIFGQIDRLKTRDELLREEAQKFIATRPPHAE